MIRIWIFMIVGGLLVFGSYSFVDVATAANASGIKRIERIVTDADLKQRGVYVLCHDDHEFLIGRGDVITITQVMKSNRRSGGVSVPKEC